MRVLACGSMVHFSLYLVYQFRWQTRYKASYFHMSESSCIAILLEMSPCAARRVGVRCNPMLRMRSACQPRGYNAYRNATHKQSFCF